MEDCFWVELDYIVEGLSVVDDSGATRGRGLVPGKAFNHGGQEAQEMAKRGEGGLHFQIVRGNLKVFIGALVADSLIVGAMYSSRIL
jgi:hypothetical protein